MGRIWLVGSTSVEIPSEFIPKVLMAITMLSVHASCTSGTGHQHKNQFYYIVPCKEPMPLKFGEVCILSVPPGETYAVSIEDLNRLHNGLCLP